MGETGTKLTMELIEPVFQLRTNSPGCPGCYHLDAYCKYENPVHEFEEFPHTPYGVETYREAVRSLKAKGWVMHRDGTATCPKCAARLKRKGKP